MAEESMRCDLELTILLSSAVKFMSELNQTILQTEHVVYSFIDGMDEKYMASDEISKEDLLAVIFERATKYSGVNCADGVTINGVSNELLKATRISCVAAIGQDIEAVGLAPVMATIAVSAKSWAGYILTNYVRLEEYFNDTASIGNLMVVRDILDGKPYQYSGRPVEINMLFVEDLNINEDDLDRLLEEQAKRRSGATMRGYIELSGDMTDEDIEDKLDEANVPPQIRGNIRDAIKAEIGGKQESTEKRHKHSQSEMRNKFLNQYTDLMNETVKLEDPFIGREKELSDTIQTLCRMKKNNPIHVGEPGVGKTAVTEGLVRLIKSGNVPDKLKGANVYRLDMGSIVAGTKYRGEFEDRLMNVLSAIIEKSGDSRPIVYIDEIHTITSAGGSEGGTNAANILKDYLTGGHISFIGATTYDEYKRIFTKDKALDRRFNKIDIKEPSRDECLGILSGAKEHYESFHKVKFSEKAIESCVDLSIRYMHDRFLPDKAIDLLDEAGALKNTHPEYLERGTVTDGTINMLISNKFGIPKLAVGKQESKRVLDLGNNFKKCVFGQDNACQIVERQMKISSVGLTDECKPKGSLLFVGPTGVGKTELAKTVANTMGIPLIRFNMSEYSDKTSVNKLIGASAGYVGYESGGLLVESVRKNPNCVLLLDEIEKADSAVFDVLLQVMDEAELVDNQGRKADFKNVLLIMTSNCGATDMQTNTLGFSTSGSMRKGSEAIDEAIKTTFKPEFVNRLTAIVKFNYIDKSTAEHITKYKLSKLHDKLEKSNKVNVRFTQSIVDYIVSNGVNESYGAREIERIIDKDIKTLLAEGLLTSQIKSGDICSVTHVKSGVKLKLKAPKEAEVI